MSYTREYILYMSLFAMLAL